MRWFGHVLLRTLSGRLQKSTSAVHDATNKCILRHSSPIGSVWRGSFAGCLFALRCPDRLFCVGAYCRQRHLRCLKVVLILQAVSGNQTDSRDLRQFAHSFFALLIPFECCYRLSFLLRETASDMIAVMETAK